MSRYLDPKSDLVFKKIFAGHPKLLKSFLNAVLPLPPDSLIEQLEYLPAENIPEIPEFKYSVVDVRCVDTKGRHFIVEMQIQWSNHFVQRMLFNTASVYVRQLNKAIKYEKLSPVYGLAIVDAVFTDEMDWFHHYRLTHAQNTAKTVDDIQLIFLELPKFKPTTVTEKKISVLWLRFLTEINEETDEVDKALLDEPEIKEALTLTEIAAYSRKELSAYERNWDAIRTHNTLMNDKLEEGRNKEREKIVRTLLSKGLDSEFVANSTGLDSAEVKKIQTLL